MTVTDIAHQLISVRHVSRQGDHAAFYRRVRAGHFTRLARGVYILTSDWLGLDERERHIARIHAAEESGPRGRVYSHLSAAALWDLPAIDGWPERAHVTIDRGPNGAARRGAAVHELGEPSETATRRGLTVTTLERTIADVARSESVYVAVAMVDHALARMPWQDSLPPLTTLEAIRAADVDRRGTRGSAMFRRAVHLSRPLSGSPGESLSRVGMHVLGVPEPVLQQRFVDRKGSIWCDFWWPEWNLVGEFDGRGKYLKDEYLDGRSTADVVLEEKDREDRVRALGPRVTRWGWGTARSLPALSAHLRSAGLRW